MLSVLQLCARLLVRVWQFLALHEWGLVKREEGLQNSLSVFARLMSANRGIVTKDFWRVAFPIFSDLPCADHFLAHGLFHFGIPDVFEHVEVQVSA